MSQIETVHPDTSTTPTATPEYTDENIRHLSDMEHVRTRPGMYIGRLGDGSLPEDGVYVLLKEVVDNSIDEFKMKSGDRIEVDVTDNLQVSVRDYGRGIPQGKLVEAVSVLNTGGKYDSKAFKKRRTERRRRESLQRFERTLRGDVVSRGQGAPPAVREGTAESRHDRGLKRRERHVHPLRTRRDAVQELPLPRRHR